jgi:hypothetical protein
VLGVRYQWTACGTALVVLSLVGCVDPCGNRILSETQTEGSPKRAVVFERDCGATTEFSTHVSILDASEIAPREGGNVFVADSDHGAVTKVRVSARWDSADHLVVIFPARARVFQQQAQVRGVSISYERTP